MISKIQNVTYHTKNAYLYAFSKGLERAFHYGFRSILILYMISESIGMPNSEAFEFYGNVTMSFYFSNLIGAALGDLLIGNKRAILIGGLLQIIGCLILCLQSEKSLYVGIITVVIGSGLFSPNVIAQFGKQYLNNSKLLDSGFTGLYFLINLGAFGSVLASGLGNDYNFIYGFIFCSILIFIATLLVYFIKDKPVEDLEYKPQTLKINKRVIYIFSAIILSGIFWTANQASYGIKISLITDGLLEHNIWTSITSGTNIVFGFFLCILWVFIYTNQFFKLFVGFLFALASFGIFALYDIESGNFILIISIVLLAISEAVIGPLLYSVATKYGNPKYLAIVLSVVTIPIMLFYALQGIALENIDENGNKEIIFIIVLAVFALVAYLISKTQKENETSDFSEEVREFLGDDLTKLD